MIKLKKWFLKRRKLQKQVEKYYAKDTYERLARKKMKAVLSEFNDIYYDAYPRMLNGSADLFVDYRPKKHSKQYEVQRAIKLCKTHKVRRRSLVKIEELLNLQYTIEDQIDYYTKEVEKTRRIQTLLDQEEFSAFFSDLYKRRMGVLLRIEAHGLKRLDVLREEKRICEQSIYELLHKQSSFLGDVSRLLGDMVSESVKHVTNLMGRTHK